MDELPELRSDEDVDALMARLRAKLGPGVTLASESPPSSEPSSDPWGDFLNAQGQFTATMLHAVQVLTDAVDELQEVPPVVAAATSKPSPREARAPRSTTSRKSQGRSRR